MRIPLNLFLYLSLVFSQTAYSEGEKAAVSKLRRVKSKQELATFAGGCFWCMEPPFEKESGVISVVSGYIGGHKSKPSYQEVSSGKTGHTEAVEIRYDPRKISYEKLLEIFWKNIDPSNKQGQFCDFGSQYRSGIFYHDAKQKNLALASARTIKSTIKANVYTEITEASQFYPAEDYHQDYYKKNPIRYKYYRYRCGRDERLKKLWKK